MIFDRALTPYKLFDTTNKAPLSKDNTELRGDPSHFGVCTRLDRVKAGINVNQNQNQINLIQKYRIYLPTEKSKVI